MVISYYAIFQYDDDGICISFPDIPSCISCAFSEQQALYMAKDALECYFKYLLFDKKTNKLPYKSTEEEIKLSARQKCLLITAHIEEKG